LHVGEDPARELASGVELARADHVQEEDLVAPRAEREHAALDLGRLHHQVGDDDRQARARMLARVHLERRAELEPPAGCDGGEQRRRAPEAAALAEERRDARRAVPGEDGDPYRAVRPEGDVRERDRQLPRERELPVPRPRRAEARTPTTTWAASTPAASAA